MRKEYLKYKALASIIAEERMRYFNEFYNYKWGLINI